MRTAKLFFSIVISIIGILSAGCSQTVEGKHRTQLTVFAASSLSDAMDQLADGFEEKYPEVEILRHYASSSQLAAQIIEGAPADIFASANKIQMEHIKDAGLTLDPPQLFASNKLTICVPLGNPAGINSPQDLANPGISLIIGASQTPIRYYTDLMLGLLGDDSFQQAVYQNVVSEEVNVRQVVAKISLGEVDAGVVYSSDLTPDLANHLEQVMIPEQFNLTAEYPLAVISTSHQMEISRQFVEFILSEEGQAVLKDWGFGEKLTSGY
jgi:molybdate transport system substrate-binding protein